jgi:hypothetical protein
MHPNAILLERLFAALNRKDHEAMAACYHPKATFEDIAFALRGRREIHDMWRMICAGDIQATFMVMHADDRAGLVSVVDDYTFSDTGRHVRNVIESRFTFQDQLILTHTDTCDPEVWAVMAMGGIRGFMAGQVGPLRRFKARRKLATFVDAHPAPAAVIGS